MNQVLSESLDNYLSELLPARSNLLTRLEQEAARSNFPIVGPLAGNLLLQLARLIRADRILELGSGFGYSALWLAQALPRDGRITCTERNPENVERLKKNFAEAGLSEKLQALPGDALEVAGRFTEQFDLIFNDVDKEEYPQTLALAKKLLRPGGLFITDNILWSGRVAQPNPDSATSSIMAFTKSLFEDAAFDCSVIPLRDGLSVATYWGER